MRNSTPFRQGMFTSSRHSTASAPSTVITAMLSRLKARAWGIRLTKGGGIARDASSEQAATAM
eukprot:5039092-Pleurochrysis_carterae.AAC.1